MSATCPNCNSPIVPFLDFTAGTATGRCQRGCTDRAALKQVVAERDSLQREVARLREAASAIYARHNRYCPPGSWLTPGHSVILAEWDALGEALSEPSTSPADQRYVRYPR